MMSEIQGNENFTMKSQMIVSMEVHYSFTMTITTRDLNLIFFIFPSPVFNFLRYDTEQEPL